MRQTKHGAAALVVGFLALAFRAGGDEPPARVRASVSVQALDFDVSITKRGEPVPDARAEDFVLKIDGKVVPLDYLTRVETGRLTGPGRGGPGGTEDDDRLVSRTFLLVIDEDHLMPGDRGRVVEAARAFVKALGPSDRLAVGVVDALRFRVLSPVGTGRREALAAVERIATERKPGLEMNAMLDSVNLRARETRAFRELERAVLAVGASPGRKELILLSRGYSRFDDPRSFGRIRPVVEEYDALVRQANCSRVTVHTISAGGLETGAGGAASGRASWG
jgi:hypothetical protein